jgi:hypothetical protein
MCHLAALEINYSKGIQKFDRITHQRGSRWISSSTEGRLKAISRRTR